MYNVTIVALSSNHCCSGKATTPSLCIVEIMSLTTKQKINNSYSKVSSWRIYVAGKSENKLRSSFKVPKSFVRFLTKVAVS